MTSSVRPSVTIRPSDVLQGTIDGAARAARVPQSFVVKGMFFSRLKSKVEDTWHELAPQLERPPRFGVFVPFQDYLQRDYLTLSILVAQRAYRDVGLREGLRRLARDDFGVFAASTFGRVVLSAVGDAHKALLTMGVVYAKMAPGEWEIRSTEIDGKTVVLEWIPNYGSWEYQLGQIEGLVRYYDVAYEVTFTEPSVNHFRFEVRHA